MEKGRIPVDRALFRSPLIPVAAVLAAVGAVCGLISVALLFAPGSVEGLVKDLYLGGITERSAVQTWKFLHIAMTALCFIWTAVMAGCLWAAVYKRPGQGLLVLATAGEWSFYALNGAGVLTLVYMVYRLIRYVIASFAINEWAYLLYAMLVSEALMIFLAVMVFVLLRRFLNGLSDTAASMARAITGGTMASGIIRTITPAGFLVLGIAELMLGLDRFFTLTIVQAFPQDYYQILVADEPLLQFSGVMFIASALCNFLLATYLWRRKRTFEKLIFQNGIRPGKM